MGFWNKWFGNSNDRYGHESAAMRRYRPQLERDHPGKVALMHGDDLVGIFEEGTAAYTEGRTRFGDGHFAVWAIHDPNKKLDPTERPDWMKREVYFAEELATFEKHRVALERDHPGRFAVVKGDRIIGVYDDLETADEEGRRLLGCEKFLFMEIADSGMPPMEFSEWNRC